MDHWKNLLSKLSTRDDRPGRGIGVLFSEYLAETVVRRNCRRHLKFMVLMVMGLANATANAGPAGVSLELIAKDGDAAPGTTGVFDLDVGPNTNPAVKIDDNGRVYFSATTTDMGREGIWVGNGGAAEAIVVDGQVLPLFEPTPDECEGAGPLCGQIFNTWAQFYLTRAGEVVMRTTREDNIGTVAYLVGTQNANLTPILKSTQTIDFPYNVYVGLATEAGEYLVDSFIGNSPFGDPDGGLSDFASPLIGATPPSIPGPVTITNVFGTSATSAGVTFGFNQGADLLFVSELSDGSEALYFDPVGAAPIELLARIGDEPPGITGAAFLQLTTTPTVGRSGVAGITDLSDGFFSGTWRFPDQPFNNNNLPRRGLWRFDAGAVPVLIVSEYLNPAFDPVFSTSEGPEMAFDNLVLIQAAPTGDIYFYGRGRPTGESGIPDSNDERKGLWRASGGGPLELVLRVNTPNVPGTPLPGGNTFFGFGLSGYGFDRNGRLVFTTLDALYAEDETGTLQMIIESGQAIQAAQNDTRIVDRILISNLGLVGGLSESFRNGRLVFNVRFDDGSFANMRASFNDPCTASGAPARASGRSLSDGVKAVAGCPAGDLILGEFKPIQAIDDVKRLIRMKNTVFQATIESTFDADQMVEIEISEEGTPVVTETVRVIANCKNTYYFPGVTEQHLTGACSNDSEFISNRSFMPQTAGSRFFKFKLDPNNKIAETAENNNLKNRIKTVVDMKKNFKIVYKTMTNLDEYQSFAPDQGLARQNTAASIKYLKNFLPLPESSVTGGLIGDTFHNLRRVTEPDQQKKKEQLTAEIRDYLKQLADSNKAAIAVGLFRAGSFINPIAGNAAAFSYTPTKGVRNKEVVNIMTTARDGLNLDSAGLKVAHEVLHTYDWVTEAKMDPRSGRHFLKDADINGYFHQDSRKRFKDAQNLMQASPSLGVVPTPVIVPHQETYDYILDTFLNNEKDPPLLYMRGWIESDGAVVDLPWIKGMGFVDLPLGLTAEFAVKYFDAGNNLLAQTGFGPALINGEPVAPTTFFYNIDDIPGARKITISRDGAILIEKIISVNAPIVTIQEPHAGDTLTTGQSVTLKWISSDTDGDDLFHNVLFSTDAGENWDILALDLTENEFTFIIPDDPESSVATFKVIVSDGVNTGEDVSDVPTISHLVFEDGFE